MDSEIVFGGLQESLTASLPPRGRVIARPFATATIATVAYGVADRL